jgi:hypothetical protein
VEASRLVTAAVYCATVAVPLPLAFIWGGIAIEEASGRDVGAVEFWSILVVAGTLGVLAIALATMALSRRRNVAARRPVLWASVAIVGGLFAIAHAGFWVSLAYGIQGTS